MYQASPPTAYSDGGARARSRSPSLFCLRLVSGLRLVVKKDYRGEQKSENAVAWPVKMEAVRSRAKQTGSRKSDGWET